MEFTRLSSKEKNVYMLRLARKLETIPDGYFASKRLKRLREAAKEAGLKISGTVEDLCQRIYSHHKFSQAAATIQRFFTNAKVRRVYLSRGPAVANRGICVNSDDFCTMEELSQLPIFQMFSYKCPDSGLVYGFNIRSFYKLYRTSHPILNPYNRQRIPQDAIRAFEYLMQTTHIPLELYSEADLEKGRTVHEEYKLAAVKLCHLVDRHGFPDISSADLMQLTCENMCHVLNRTFAILYAAGFHVTYRRPKHWHQMSFTDKKLCILNILIETLAECTGPSVMKCTAALAIISTVDDFLGETP